MEKQTITIHRALAELKLIDSKIEKGISEMKSVAIGQKDKKIGGYLNDEEFAKQAQSGYDSVKDLITRKAQIKKAIVESNSKTTVKIGEKEFTVSDAITQKNIIEQKKRFLSALQSQFRAHVATMNKNNEQVNANVEKLLVAALGTESKTAQKETIENISKPFLEANTWSLIDPLKIEEKIKLLETEITSFETEVDAVLSESNAVTQITI